MSIPTRNDFRCEVCRQKSVFHCEHDTPYRDQYLGTSEENFSRRTPNSSRRSVDTNRTSKTDNRPMNTNNDRTGKMDTNRSTNGRVGGVQYQQGQRPNPAQTNPPVKAQEQNSKSKSCVIL